MKNGRAKNDTACPLPVSVYGRQALRSFPALVCMLYFVYLRLYTCYILLQIINNCYWRLYAFAALYKNMYFCKDMYGRISLCW